MWQNDPHQCFPWKSSHISAIYLQGSQWNVQKHWENLEKFLVENSKEDNNSHLIKWAKVISPKDKGGLRINKITDTNFVLLSKWLWRLITQNQPLWKKLISAKYTKDSNSGFPTKEKFSSLRASWRSFIKGIDWFPANVKWQLNNGEKISFWYGSWNEKSLLSLYKPRLFALSNLQNGSVKDMWNSQLQDWDFHPRRPLRSIKTQ